MALPTWIGIGSVPSGTGTVQPTVPGTTNDTLLLFVESDDENVVTPGGWRLVGHIEVSGETRLTVFTKRKNTASETGPVIADPGDHVLAFIAAVRNASGLMHLVLSDSGSETGAGQTQTIDGSGTTTEADCLMIIASSHSVDDANVSFSAWTNAAFANITERVDVGTTQGNGGGIGLATGELATAGAFGATTVVNARTDPHWAAFVLAVSPKAPPANDNFSNAILLVDGTSPEEGATYDAGTETGEPLVASGFFGYDRTQWWKYTAPSRHIINLRALVPDSLGGLAMRVWRGSAVNALSQYATSSTNGSTSFGEESGRGQLGTWAQSFVDPASVPFRVQADPGTELFVQVGRLTSFFGLADQEYDLEFEFLDPPANDDFDDAEAHDLTPPTPDDLFTTLDLAFDLEGATGQVDFPGTSAHIGDIWYKLTTDTPVVAGFRHVKDDAADDADQHLVHVYSGDDISGLTQLLTLQGSGATEDDDPMRQLELVAGVTYYVRVLVGIQSNSVWTGTLHVEHLPPPANDDFADAEDLGSASSGSTLVASIVGATGEEDEPFGTYGATIWYKFIPTNGGWYALTYDVLPTFVQTYWAVAAYRGTAIDSLELTSLCGYLDPNNTDTILALRGGETYYIQLQALLGSPTHDFGEIFWNLVEPTTAINDDRADVEVISGASGTLAGQTMAGTTNEAGETGHTEEYPGYVGETYHIETSAWYEWECPATGKYVFGCEGGLAPEIYAVYMHVWDDDPATVPQIAANFTGDADLMPRIVFDATIGTTYTVMVQLTKAFASTFPGPYVFGLVWDAYVPATDGTFADAIPIDAFHTDTLPLGETYGQPLVPEAGTPDVLTLFADEGFTQFGRCLWYAFTPQFTGTYESQFEAPGSQVFFGWFEGALLGNLEAKLDADGFPAIGYSDGDPWTLGELELEAGTTYYLLVGGFQWDSLTYVPHAWTPQGQFTLSWTMAAPTNDDFASMQGFSPDDLGNLNWFETYVYAGVENGPYDGFPSGGCRRFSNIAATAEVGEPGHPGGFPATRTLWMRWQPPVAGDFKIWIEPIGSNPVLDPMIVVYDHATTFGGLAAPLASDDDTNGLYPEVTYNVAFDYETVLIQIDARDEGEFLLRFEWINPDPPPANDDFADAIDIADAVVESGDTTGATVECGETPPAGFWGGPDGSVWYRFVATDTVDATLTLATSGMGGFDNYQILDVFHGTSLDALINETDADGFYNASFNETTVLPFTMVAGETYYFRVSALENLGHPFDLTLDTESLIPPGNDDFDDATTVTGGTTVGNIDGATLEAVEPDPTGGTITGGSAGSGAGTTWHKYIATAPGFLNIWVDRDGQPISQWYRVGVWEGPSKTMTKLVTCMTAFSRHPTLPFRPFYEVREGQTYWIQVIRESDQSWGDYNLHIEEFLETEEWEQADGFTSTTNSPGTAGDILTCTGNQDIEDSLDVLPQYGSVDLGSDVGKWGRETRIYCEVRVVAGQVLWRNMWNGRDDWPNDPRTIALSDDHSGYQTARLGLLRARDKDGAFAFAVSLAPNNKGENFLEFMGETGIHVTPISMGNAVPQHESGWVGIEVVLTANNLQNHDGTWNTASYPYWTLHAYVDGRPIDNSTTALFYIGKQIRYVDFGTYRHPSMYGIAGNPAVATDQRYSENNEAWTTETRNARITNIVPRLPFDVELKGDRGIFEFDGFASEVPWKAEGNRHTFATSPTAGFPVAAVPEKPGWGAFRSVSPGTRCRVTYGLQNGSRRFYCASLFPDTFPASKQPISGYAAGAGGLSATGGGMGVLLLDGNGELRIRPYGYRDFCVAHLVEGEHYFIEVHVDAEVMWDVRCTVYINGNSYGVFTNVYTYGQVGALTSGSIPVGAVPAGYQSESFLNFNYLAGSLINHDLRFTNLVAGRAPGGMLGPVQAIVVGAATEAGIGHHIPDFPASADDVMELLTADNSNHSTLYNWMTEVGPIVQPGPFTIIAADIGHNRTYPFTQLERYWEEFYRLQPTTALEVAGTEFTKFGQSVPVDDLVTVVGIEVRAPTGGTAQLMKAGLPVGSTDTDSGDGIYGGPTDLWGTTWAPEEVNGEGFGVDLSGVGAAASEVKVEVYFADEGGPDGVARGGSLGAEDLHNFYGDQLVCEWLATGSGDSMHAAGFWDGGEPGGTRGPERVLSGTPQQCWGSALPLWFWQARGVKSPSVDFIVDVAGDQAQVTDYRCVRNPLVYPRFAWSLDDGVTWDWIQAFDETDSTVIGTDVGEDSGGDALFLDNNAALDRFEINNNGWSSGLNEDRPSASSSYRFPYWYLTYGNPGTIETEVLATNLWLRWRPYSGYPKEAAASSTTFRAYAALPDGGVRRVGIYSGGGTEASPSLGRFTSARDPDGEAWDAVIFDDLLLRLGFNNNTQGGPFAWVNVQSGGACVYAATWELLVPADADSPPAGCLNIVSMNWRLSDRRAGSNRVLIGDR